MRDKYNWAHIINLLLYFLQGVFVLVIGYNYTDVSHRILFLIGMYWVVTFFVICLLHVGEGVGDYAFGVGLAICSCALGLFSVYVVSSVMILLALYIAQIPCSLILAELRLLRTVCIIQIFGLVLIYLQTMFKVNDYFELWMVVVLSLILILTAWVSDNFLKYLIERENLSAEYEQSMDGMRDLAEIMCDEARAATRSKSEFLSSMSHEIRTPINSVIGMNEMILRECKDPQIFEYARNVEQASNMLLAIINDILDFSKIESGKMKIIPVEYELSSILGDLDSMIRTRIENKGIEFNVNVDERTPEYLFGDEVRIRQIAMNLLTNAEKYTYEGSVSLNVNTKDSENEKETILCIEVKDTGRGIKEKDMGNLFDAFKRVDEMKNRSIEGTGLGLAITNSFVQLMDGKLEVESEYGIGSTFRVELPQPIVKEGEIGDIRERFKKASEKKQVYTESFVAPDARILVVDDNKMNIMVVQHLLKTTKVMVDTISSGKAAITRLEKINYDAVFLDHMMPELDGVETLNIIRSKNLAVGTPFIALTANAISGAKDMYIRYGFNDYLSKPISGVDLERMLIKWLPKEKVTIK